MRRDVLGVPRVHVHGETLHQRGALGDGRYRAVPVCPSAHRHAEAADTVDSPTRICRGVH